MKTKTETEAVLVPEFKKKTTKSQQSGAGGVRGGEKPGLGEVCDAYSLTELIVTERSF